VVCCFAGCKGHAIKCCCDGGEPLSSYFDMFFALICIPLQGMNRLMSVSHIRQVATQMSKEMMKVQKQNTHQFSVLRLTFLSVGWLD